MNRAAASWFASAHRVEFADGGIEHGVLRGGQGPAVLLLHELPGMGPEFGRLAGRVAEAGFTVYAPLFFGKPGRRSVLAGCAALRRLCVRHEFRCLARNEPSQIAPWLRALARRAHDECGGPGVGAIGMCMTGGLVLSLMLDESMLAPVMCQPALPFAFDPRIVPGNLARRRALGVPDADVEAAAQRARTVPVHAYRFESDLICPRERFVALRARIPTGLHVHELRTPPKLPWQVLKNFHAIFTDEYVEDDPDHVTQQALREVLQHLSTQLKPPLGGEAL